MTVIFLLLKTLIVWRFSENIWWRNNWFVWGWITCCFSLFVSKYFGCFCVLIFFIAIFHDPVRILHWIFVDNFEVYLWNALVWVVFRNWYFDNIRTLKLIFGTLMLFRYLIDDILISKIPYVIRNVRIRKHDINFGLFITSMIVFRRVMIATCW